MCIRDRYDFSIKYCKASDNKMADKLGRYPSAQQENYSCERYEIQILAAKYVLPNEAETVLKTLAWTNNGMITLKKINYEIKIKDSPKFQIFNNTLYKLIYVWPIGDNYSGSSMT